MRAPKSCSPRCSHWSSVQHKRGHSNAELRSSDAPTKSCGSHRSDTVLQWCFFIKQTQVRWRFGVWPSQTSLYLWSPKHVEWREREKRGGVQDPSRRATSSLTWAVVFGQDTRLSETAKHPHTQFIKGRFVLPDRAQLQIIVSFRSPRACVILRPLKLKEWRILFACGWMEGVPLHIAESNKESKTLFQKRFN